LAPSQQAGSLPLAGGGKMPTPSIRLTLLSYLTANVTQ